MRWRTARKHRRRIDHREGYGIHSFRYMSARFRPSKEWLHWARSITPDDAKIAWEKPGPDYQQREVSEAELAAKIEELLNSPGIQKMMESRQ